MTVKALHDKADESETFEGAERQYNTVGSYSVLIATLFSAGAQVITT